MSDPKVKMQNARIDADAKYFGKRKTCKRENIPGHAHSLTFSCFRGKPFLSRDRSRQWFVKSLSAARDAHAFDIWAYVIMPEHVHLLIFPRNDEYSIADILGDIKRPVAQKALRFVRETAPSFLETMRDEQPNGIVRHRFWQRGGGFDRNLVEPSIIHSTIDYIHANPVRRGLVESPDDWQWSSAVFYSGCTGCVLEPNVASLPGRKQ